MFTVNTARKVAIPITIAAIIGSDIGCGDDRLRSEDVSFPDPALQECFEEILTTPSGKPYADEIELLRCTFSDIVSLEGIDVLSGLKEVNLRESPNLNIIEPLLSLPALTRLDLSNCGLGPESTEVLSKLEVPVYLEISLNNLGDISAYSQITALTGLIAESSNITKGVAELIALTNAAILSLYGNPASPCVDLEYLRMNIPEAVSVFPSESDTQPGIDCAP